MRKFIDGNGVESTDAANQYLSSHRQLSLPDLYVITPAPRFAGDLPGNSAITSAKVYILTQPIAGTQANPLHVGSPSGAHYYCTSMLKYGFGGRYLWGSILHQTHPSPGYNLYDGTWNPSTELWEPAAGASPDVVTSYPDFRQTCISIWSHAYDGHLSGSAMNGNIWGGVHTVPDQFLIYDAYMDVTYANGNTSRLRPTAVSTSGTDVRDMNNFNWPPWTCVTPQPNPRSCPITYASVTNLANILDRNPATAGAFVLEWCVGAGGPFLALQLTNWVDECVLDGNCGAMFDGLNQGLGKGFYLTDYPSDLVWDYKGKFVTADISRGEVQSKVGFEADTLDITWAPKDTDVLAGGKLTMLQSFGYGIFDNADIEVWRGLMPQPGDLVGSPAAAAKLGDLNTFGASLMFSGRVGDIVVGRDKATLKLISRMETLNVQVPSNLIEPTNVYAYCTTGIVPVLGSPTLTILAGSNPQIIYCNPAVPVDTYAGGFLVFQTGDLKGFYARIMWQSVVTLSSSPLVTATMFTLAEQLPFSPDIGDVVIGYVGMPRDASGTPYGGFRWVPAPDNSAVIV